MMLDLISKILDVLLKYAWGLFVVCIVIIVLPNKTAVTLGLNELRQTYLGYIWLMTIFTASICGGSALSRIVKYVSQRRITNKRINAVLKRLNALDTNEMMWIIYCLYNNTMTLPACQTNRTANSLLQKGIVSMGSGSVLALPFTIKDFVWDHLQNHKQDFLQHTIADDPQLQSKLNIYARKLQDPLS